MSAGKNDITRHTEIFNIQILSTLWTLSNQSLSIWYSVDEGLIINKKWTVPIYMRRKREYHYQINYTAVPLSNEQKTRVRIRI
jgi:hypothetical protein